MSDDPQRPKLVAFPTPPVQPDFVPLAPPDKVRRVGMFPLGSNDVVLSLDVLNAILGLLEYGDATRRKQMADMLRVSYYAPFTPAGGP